MSVRVPPGFKTYRALEDGELMPEGENLCFELKTRANGGPEGGEQSDEQS